MAETRNAAGTARGDRDAVIYIPRYGYRDGVSGTNEPTKNHPLAPTRATRIISRVVTKSRTLDNVAWSYEDPTMPWPRSKVILAFYQLPESPP